MRTIVNSAIQYSPGDPPADPAQLQRYLREENAKLSAVIALLAAEYEVVYVAPAKPRKGMKRIADGTSWNPGSGYGFYIHNGTAWVLVKAL